MCWLYILKIDFFFLLFLFSYYYESNCFVLSFLKCLAQELLVTEHFPVMLDILSCACPCYTANNTHTQTHNNNNNLTNTPKQAGRDILNDQLYGQMPF